MKTKFLLLTGVAMALFLTACKTDEPSNNNASLVLPKKIVETYSGSTQTRTMDFSYDGKKIKEILITPAYDESKVKYTYSGNNITKIESFIGTDYAIWQTMEFTYQNDKVSSSTTKNSKGEVTYNYTYTYNSDNSVTVLTEPKIQGYTPYKSKYYFKDNNLVKQEFMDTKSDKIYSRNIYEYDLTKNSCTRNIYGIAYLFTGNLDGNVNSLTKRSDITISSSTGAETSVDKTYTSEYNANGYPTKITETNLSRTKTQVITY